MNMKKVKKLLVTAICLAFIVTITVLSGCSDNSMDDVTDFNVTNGPHPGAKVERVELASLPEWLAKLFENGQFSSFGATQGKVFRGEWNGKIVYHIFNPMSSCVYCEMFYEDGNAIVFDSEDIIRSFRKTSKNWTFIYI